MIKSSFFSKKNFLLASLIVWVIGRAQETNAGIRGSFANPFKATFIQQELFTFSVASFIGADSVIWNVVYMDTSFNKNFIYAGASVELLSDAKLTAVVRSQGVWYKHELDFHGIVYELESDMLYAATVKNAKYDWFLNGNYINVHTSFYKPTAVGTYMVIVTWEDLSDHVGEFERVAHTTKTAIFTFTIDALAGFQENNPNFATLSLYPNPAHDSFGFGNYMQTIHYRIEDLKSVLVKEGQTTNGASVNIGNLQPGIYLIHIKSDQLVGIQRLMVE